MAPNPIITMANLQDRLPENIRGRFYVDSSCIDCDLCRETAPGFFRSQDDIGSSVVYRQPVTPEEIELAEEALSGCPADSIGNDGPDIIEENAQNNPPKATESAGVEDLMN